MRPLTDQEQTEEVVTNFSYRGWNITDRWLTGRDHGFRYYLSVTDQIPFLSKRVHGCTLKGISFHSRQMVTDILDTHFGDKPKFDFILTSAFRAYQYANEPKPGSIAKLPLSANCILEPGEYFSNHWLDNGVITKDGIFVVVDWPIIKGWAFGDRPVSQGWAQWMPLSKKLITYLKSCSS